jgi:hypothetical protein
MGVVACPPNTPPVHGVVTFDPNVFKAIYPEFTTVAAAALNLNFALAQLILNNTCQSSVCDATVRETLLNVLVAHITALFNGVNGQPASGVVGRVAGATEGTVSVTIEYAAGVSQSQAWFVQTPYGALFWQMTVGFRTMRYISAPASCGPAGTWPGRRGC